MKCPNCRADNNIVIDSRSDKSIQKRVRVCRVCGARFKTQEKIWSHTRITEKPLPEWYAKRVEKGVKSW